MFDKQIASQIKPVIDRIAKSLILCGLRANLVTALSFLMGLTSAVFIAQADFGIGCALLLLSRLGDALDGAIARQTSATARGGFLDITLDFIVYASIPLAFAVANPLANALAAATLLFFFMGTSASFLAYAAIAAMVAPNRRTTKSIYFLDGLTEAFETLLCFCLMCLFPADFAVLAYGFSLLCGVTTVTRIYAGWRDFD
jgi:phosphatidylglycerophosphate synthase